MSLPDLCRMVALRVQMRLDVVIARDGSEEAALKGKGFAIGYLLGRTIARTLADAADEYERRASELLAANAREVEARRNAEHEASIWREAARVLADAHHAEHAARLAIAAELRRVRAGIANAHDKRAVRC